MSGADLSAAPVGVSAEPAEPLWRVLVPASEVPEGEPYGCKTTDAANSWLPLVLVRVGEEIRAFDGHCPHRAAPLSQMGAVDLEEGTLTCTWHCWVFRLSDGGHTVFKGLGLRRYAVRINDAGIVEVEVSPLIRAPSVAHISLSD